MKPASLRPSLFELPDRMSEAEVQSVCRQIATSPVVSALLRVTDGHLFILNAQRQLLPIDAME